MALIGVLGLPALATLGALCALAVTAHAAPARTVAGGFVSVTVVPAAQILVGVFLGRRAAFGVGAAVTVLTILLVVGPPPRLALQETQWQLTMTGPQLVAQTILARPPRSSGIDAMPAGARAEIFVCLPVGDASDVEVRMNDVELRALPPTFPAQCWKQFSVPLDAIAGAPDTLEVSVAARHGAEVVLTGGYTRPRAEGGQSGGAVLLAAGGETRGDLSPTAPGNQVGRFFVELRVFGADGQLVEIWY